jgi:prepilin-type N-terminal cleavage/methylation domain-containing protein
MKIRKYVQKVSGFTLIELLVGISVAGIMMAIATPAFYSLLPGIRLSSAARQVATDLQYARTRAISQHTPITVTFGSPEDGYSFDSNSRDLGQLYPGTTATAAADPTFSSLGTANATTITLSNGSATKTIEVTAIGRVKIL